MLRIFTIVLTLCLCLACQQQLCTPTAPPVDPEITKIGSDFIYLKWNSLGLEYIYEVVLLSDTITNGGEGTELRRYTDLFDTAFTINDLKQETVYRVKILSYSNNSLVFGESPTLRFKTE